MCDIELVGLLLVDSETQIRFQSKNPQILVAGLKTPEHGSCFGFFKI
jgi:hypothetical protein